jgi:hypothetical protein
MWQPEPSWERLRSGGSPATAGVWAAEVDGRRWIVKRLAPPDEPELHDPRHAGYWRREAEVALHPGLFAGPGLVLPDVRTVEEDDEGVTIWTEDVAGSPPTALHAARALGRFASQPPPEVSWASTSILAGRLAFAEARGGWPTLARTTLADVADALWRSRHHWLDRVAGGPQGQVHGDVTPGNLPGVRGDDLVAIDWQCWGSGPVGADLGYFALSCREDFEVLLEAFAEGAEVDDRDAVTTAARVTLVYTAFTRAEWALATAARGEGALAGKYRHPSVAPHLRALQRQVAQIEALLV